MSEEINVSKIHADKLLARLYNRARVQGLGVLHAKDGDMTPDQAAELLSGEESQYFDYLHGRVMKIEINGNRSIHGCMTAIMAKGRHKPLWTDCLQTKRHERTVYK